MERYHWKDIARALGLQPEALTKTQHETAVKILAMSKEDPTSENIELALLGSLPLQ